MFSFSRAVVVFALAAAAVWGQADANKGSITGIVTDPNGAVVPNAQVKIKNAATGFTREVLTNESGVYRAPLLDPGSYEVTAKSSGFALTTITGLVLNVGSAVTADIGLKLEATTTSVEVGETLINLVTPSQSSVVNEFAISHLPINGRRFQDFAVMAPTVQVEPLRSQLSFAGQRGINSNVMLDGADYNQPFFGGIRGGERSNSVITIPQSAVQEFQVVTTGYAAEYGRSTGGVLNTITKSGANDFHGDAFYQLRHRTLSSENPIFLVKPSETLQQWGGSSGGRIRRDKMFWFAAYEGQASNIPRQVFFPQLVGRTATADTAEAFNYYKSEEKPFKQTNRAYAVTGRGDYQFAKGHRLTTRYNFSNSTEENAVTVGGAINPFTNNAVSNEGTEKDRTHNGTVQYTHLFSPSVVNDVRFTGSYEVRPRLANAEVPVVSASLIGTFGTRSFLSTTQDDTRYQLTDGVSISSGNHTAKLGIDFSHISTGQLFGFNQFGSFSVGGSDVNTVLDIMTAGGAIANRFDNTNVTYSRQIGNLIAAYKLNQFALFAQDSWRVAPKLTLDLGLRWEGQWNPTPDANNTAVLQRVQGVRFPLGTTLDPTRIPNTIGQVMPRFGFAWTPISGSHRTVVRGHTGLYYAATPLLVFAGPTNNFRVPPGDVSISVGGSGTQLTVYQAFLAAGVDLNRSPLNQLPIIPIETVQRASALALGGQARDPYIGANFTPMAPDFHNPRAFQSGFGVDSELFRNFIAGVQLTYVNTVHLLRNRDYNLPAPILLAGDQSQRPNIGIRSAPGIRNAVSRPISTIGQLIVRDSSARSMYRAATFQAQYRTKKLQVQAFYTLAESYSDDDSERDATGYLYTNSFDLKPEYNYSNIDVRHQIAANAVATLPWGFELAGIYRIRSGQPLTARTNNDENQDNVFNDRPYAAAGIPFLRNSFRNRAFTTTDFRFLKNFPLGERRKIQFSTEFFNLFNADNVRFGGNAAIYGPGLMPNGTQAAIDARFMRLRLANGRYDTNNEQIGNPRQIQFGLRFFF
ncbi:MAG: TonB-dependent receptor [Acidobacteria bacterium]|nr:TonB-dependent receptor [Acidobacteriota bacterium]